MSRLVFLYNNIFEYEYAYVRIMYKCFQKTKKNLVWAGLGIIIIIYEVKYLFSGFAVRGDEIIYFLDSGTRAKTKQIRAHVWKIERRKSGVYGEVLNRWHV